MKPKGNELGFQRVLLKIILTDEQRIIRTLVKMMGISSMINCYFDGQEISFKMELKFHHQIQEPEEDF